MENGSLKDVLLYGMKQFLIIDQAEVEDLDIRVKQFLSRIFNEDITEKVEVEIDFGDYETEIEIEFTELRDLKNNYTPSITIHFTNHLMPFYGKGRFFTKAVYGLVDFSVDPEIEEKYDIKPTFLNNLLTC